MSTPTERLMTDVLRAINALEAALGRLYGALEDQGAVAPPLSPPPPRHEPPAPEVPALRLEGEPGTDWRRP